MISDNRLAETAYSSNRLSIALQFEGRTGTTPDHARFGDPIAPWTRRQNRWILSGVKLRFPSFCPPSHSSTEFIMGDTRIVEPVVRMCAVISHSTDARQWAIDELTADWGQPLVVTDLQPFDTGGFYRKTMGESLFKQLVAFADLIEPGTLADWKHQTNDLETRWNQEHQSVVRELNLDPGYVTQAKLVLATTKDRDHRIYLRDGMFAEVTLNYVGKKWIHHRWSYPDYRTEAVAKFATTCRNHLRAHLLETDSWRRV